VSVELRLEVVVPKLERHSGGRPGNCDICPWSPLPFTVLATSSHEPTAVAGACRRLDTPAARNRRATAMRVFQ